MKDPRAKESKTRLQEPQVSKHQPEASKKTHKDWKQKNRHYIRDQRQ